MSASEKAQLELNSKIAKGSFEWLARENPRSFMEGFNSWTPEYQAEYKAMTPEDQLAIINKAGEMRQTGVRPDAIDKVMQDVVNEAKRFAPDLMDGSDKNKSVRFQFEGILYNNARALSAMQGGQPINSEQARQIVLQSLGEYDTKKYGAGVNVALNFDADLYRRVKAQQQTKLGREPTKEETLQAYQAVIGN